MRTSLKALFLTLVSPAAMAAGVSEPCTSDAQCDAGLVCVADNCLQEGRLMVTLSWQADTDLDVRLELPDGVIISPELEHTTAASGGRLTRDECYREEDCIDGATHKHVEHIVWPFDKVAPTGGYEVWVQNHSGKAPAEFAVDVRKADGQRETLSGSVEGTEKAESARLGFRVNKDVCEVDTDQDGLCDAWETNGVDINDDGVIDLNLPALGAKPNRKDLFVEIDRWKGETVFGLGSVVAAFAAAPVKNPDGSSGITLHILNDEEVTQVAGAELAPATKLDYKKFDLTKYGTATVNADTTSCENGWFGTAAERASENCENIIKARSKVYRYALYVYELDGIAASGLGELPGNDFIVSVGNAGAANTQKIQSAVFMHELGHNLKLGHGGGDNENNKANYLSVMNYFYIFPYGYAGRPLDFSRFLLAPLDERSLDETVGIQGPASWKQVIFSKGGSKVVTNTDASQGLDFDQSGSLSKPVVSDVNGDGNTSVLKSHHDWDNALLAFQNLPNPNKAFGDELPYDPNDEPSLEDALEQGRKSDSDQDGFNNVDDNCPTVVNAGQEDADGDLVGDACDACPELAAPGYENGCPEEGTNTPGDTTGDNTDDDQKDEEFEPSYVSNDGGCSATGAAPEASLTLLLLGLFGWRRRKSNS